MRFLLFTKTQASSGLALFLRGGAVRCCLIIRPLARIDLSSGRPRSPWQKDWARTTFTIAGGSHFPLPAAAGESKINLK